MNVNPARNEVLRNLLYAEVFRYPVLREELRVSNYDASVLSDAVDALLNEGLIHEYEGFLFVFDECGKVALRNAGNQRAATALPKAKKIARFIYRFPFVEGVGISGSLSKGTLDEDGDFDYFVITRPNRLWLARTLLIAYKKVFLLNSRKQFCLNYFIDSDHLSIEDRNLFTATEVATLIPVCGNALVVFRNQNQWIADFGKVQRPVTEELTDMKKNSVVRFFQWSMNGAIGEWFDRFCMKLTVRQWKRKFPHFSAEKFDLTLKSRPYISKHHPNDFQTKVLNRYDELKDRYSNEYNLQSITEVPA